MSSKLSRLLCRIYKELQQQHFSVMSTPQLTVVFVRHGQSEWNARNLFTGWFDSPLTNNGREEAQQAGKNLNRLKFRFDKCFTSQLVRSMETMDIILKELGQQLLPVERSWRLNERHYGNLTGMNKKEAMRLYGEAQVHQWRRSFDTLPPPIMDSNEYFKIINGASYPDLKPEDIPTSESLKTTILRVLPFWESNIVPDLKVAKHLIIAAHGNSLRAIVMHLYGIVEEGIQHLNLPTGMPFIIPLTKEIKATKLAQFIGNEKKATKAMGELQRAIEVKANSSNS